MLIFPHSFLFTSQQPVYIGAFSPLERGLQLKITLSLWVLLLIWAIGASLPPTSAWHRIKHVFPCSYFPTQCVSVGSQPHFNFFLIAFTTLSHFHPCEQFRKVSFLFLFTVSFSLSNLACLEGKVSTLEWSSSLLLLGYYLCIIFTMFPLALGITSGVLVCWYELSHCTWLIQGCNLGCLLINNPFFLGAIGGSLFPYFVCIIEVLLKFCTLFLLF